MACGSTLLYYISHIAVLYFSAHCCTIYFSEIWPGIFLTLLYYISLAWHVATITAARSRSRCPTLPQRSLPSSVLSGRSRGEASMASMASPLGSSIAGSSAGRCWTKHSKPKMYVVSSEYLRQLMPTFAKKKLTRFGNCVLSQQLNRQLAITLE